MSLKSDPPKPPKQDAGIEAGLGIKAGWGIVSGFWIKCKKELSAKHNIFAGTAAFKKPSKEQRVIECSKLVSGEICYGDLRIINENAEEGEE